MNKSKEGCLYPKYNLYYTTDVLNWNLPWHEDKEALNLILYWNYLYIYIKSGEKRINYDYYYIEKLISVI